MSENKIYPINQNEKRDINDVGCCSKEIIEYLLTFKEMNYDMAKSILEETIKRLSYISYDLNYKPFI